MGGLPGASAGLLKAWRCMLVHGGGPLLQVFQRAGTPASRRIVQHSNKGKVARKAGVHVSAFCQLAQVLVLPVPALPSK